MASALFRPQTDNSGKKRPIHNIVAFSKTSGHPVTIPIMLDTGAVSTHFDLKYARLLGVENTLNTGVPFLQASSFGGKGATRYGQQIRIQIGNMKPITVLAYFSNMGGLPNLLGIGSVTPNNYSGVLNHYKIYIDENKIRYDEVSPQAKMNAAYAQAYLAQQSWKRRI